MLDICYQINLEESFANCFRVSTDEFRVVAGEDACECATKIKVPCAQQKPPSCNETCHELIETSDGCCREWVSWIKPCCQCFGVEF